MSATAIEPVAPRDIERVAAIHKACFDDAWSDDMIRRVLGTAGAFGLVARASADLSVVAFALARIVVDECELLSLGVAPDRQRQGIGAALLDAAMDRAAALRVRHFFLEVGEFNAPARRLYESRGLKVVGRRAGYYAIEGGRRDGRAHDALRAGLPRRKDRPGRRAGDLRAPGYVFAILRTMSPSRTVLSGARLSRAGSSRSGRIATTRWPSSVTDAGTFSIGSAPRRTMVAVSPDAMRSIRRRVRTKVIGQTSAVMSRKCSIAAIPRAGSDYTTCFSTRGAVRAEPEIDFDYPLPTTYPLLRWRSSEWNLGSNNSAVTRA